MERDNWNTSNVKEISNIRSNTPKAFFFWNTFKQLTRLLPLPNHYAIIYEKHFVENWNWRLTFSRKMDQLIYKNLSLSQNLLKMLLYNYAGELILILFSFIFGIRNFQFISSELSRNQIVGKLLKSQCQDILFCTS